MDTGRVLKDAWSLSVKVDANRVIRRVRSYWKEMNG